MSNVTAIQFRFIEIKDNDEWVIKKDDNHTNGYYDFLIFKDELQEIMDSDNIKSELYEAFAIEYNRSFMEFLMFEVCINNLYIASAKIGDTEYSYLEEEYMDESYLYDDVKTRYGEEFGMVSDFDFYPYGLE